MKAGFHSKTPDAKALLEAWTCYRNGQGDFTFEQAERLFIDVPDRRDWALILDGLPGARAVLARLSDAMDRCEVAPNGRLRPRASGQISEVAALNFAWSMVDRWQAVVDALPDPKNVYEVAPYDVAMSDPFTLRWMQGEAYSFDFEVIDAVHRQGVAHKSEGVPPDVFSRLRRALRSGDSGPVERYVLHPMQPWYVDPVAEFELYLGGFEMAFGTKRDLLVAPVDPALWT